MEEALAVARAERTGKFGGFRAAGAAQAQWWDAWIRPVCDATGAMLKVNHAAVELSGFPMPNIIGPKFCECG